MTGPAGAAERPDPWCGDPVSGIFIVILYNAVTPFTGLHLMQPSPYKNSGGLLHVFDALGYSLRGLGAAWRHETAFRQELMLAIVLVPLALWLGHSVTERLLLVGVLVLVLMVELLNSAIEALADALSTEFHPLLGRAKDLGSAAVLLSLLLAAATWLCILVPRAWPIQ